MLTRGAHLVALATKSMEKYESAKEQINKNRILNEKELMKATFVAQDFQPPVRNETHSHFRNGIDFDLAFLAHQIQQSSTKLSEGSRKKQDSVSNLNTNACKTNDEQMVEYGKEINSKSNLKTNLEHGYNQFELSAFETFEESCDDSISDPDYSPKLVNNRDTEESSDDEMNLRQMADLIETALDDEINTYAKTNTKPKNIRKIRQVQRNIGQRYTTNTGKIVSARKLIPLETCRKQCRKYITVDQQTSLFKNYWNLGSYKERVLYISGLLRVLDKKVHTIKRNTIAPRNRWYTIQYYIEIDGKSISVCQKCFRKCFGETESFLKSVVKKKVNAPEQNFKDMRGCKTPANKLNDSKIQEIQQHINSFPNYESHYCRRDTSKMYFHSSLNLNIMYRLYCELYDSPVSFTKYRDIFHTMGIKFKSPAKDTCSLCDKLKLKMEVVKQETERIELKLALEQHHCEAELAYECKTQDKQLSKCNESMAMFTFDLQQCLPTPYLKSSVSFYKRQLWTYNLTIHDCKNDQPYCYMWHEALAKRGGNEISSCLIYHLYSLPANISRVIFYSDSCPGQNKNSFVATMFLTFLNCSENVTTIDHKFLVPGHTHMECDSDHSVIERAKKKSNSKLHHPRDWYQFIANVGGKKKFKVVEMNVNDFKDFNAYSKSKFIWRKSNEDGEKFVWSQVKWMRFTKENFGVIYYKETLNENAPFKKLNLRKRGVNNVNIEDVTTCYTQSLPISNEKKKDLLEQLPLIDPIFHSFYKSLISNDEPNVHPDLVSDSEDD